MVYKGTSIAALDIGSTKVACLIMAERKDQLEVVGFSCVECSGLKKGMVVDMDAIIVAIQDVIGLAQKQACIRVRKVLVGIAGDHMQSLNGSGMIPLLPHAISEQELKKVLEVASSVAMPLDRQLIHVLPQEYRINDHGGIQQPLGMRGVRLEAKVHIVTASFSASENLIQCVRRAGFLVSELVFEPLASRYAVLCQDEMDVGVVLIDMGGSTTSVAIFKEGALIYSWVLPMGGSHITQDIAMALSTPYKEAERLKKEYGMAAYSDLKIDVEGMGGRASQQVGLNFLSHVMQLRVEEMLHLINKKIIPLGIKKLLFSGVVLTGGATLLKGMPLMVEQVLEMPVKIGFPQEQKKLPQILQSPCFATLIGLIQYAQQKKGKAINNKKKEGLREAIGMWMRDFF